MPYKAYFLEIKTFLDTEYSQVFKKQVGMWQVVTVLGGVNFLFFFPVSVSCWF